jgi:hypothetical protein
MRDLRKHFKKPLILVGLLLSFSVIAFPIAELSPTSSDVPITSLSSQPDKIILADIGTYKDMYLFTVEGTSLTIVDVTLWDDATDQPENFDDSVVDAALLSNGTSLIIALSDGDIARIELDDTDTFTKVDPDDATDDDEEESEDDEDDEDTEDDEEETTDDDSDDQRIIDISGQMTSAGISHMVADNEDDIVYLTNSDGYYFIYDIESSNFTEAELTNSASDDEEEDPNYSPADMLFVDHSSAGKRIFIATDEGVLLYLSAGSTSATEKSISSSSVSATPSLDDLSLSPDGEYLYIVDSANDVVWVYEISSDAFVDQLNGGSDPDPILFDEDQNDEFTHVAVYTDGTNTVGYVSGENGLTLIDADDPDAKEDGKVYDIDTTDGDDEDPVVLTGTPGPIVASFDDGYIYSANSDASIAVLTDNPFVTIGSIDPSSVNSETSSFTITFQSDAAGSYTVRSNGGPLGDSGEELADDTDFTDADTDATETFDINNFDRDAFIEGENKIFVYATDSSGNVGRTAIRLTVDRPPEAITITGNSFGNEKAYIAFTPSEDADIDYYQLLAEPADSQSNPDCPGSLTFTSGSTVSSTLEPSECSDDSCTGIVTGLSNDTTYCVAMFAVDEAGQTGELSSISDAVTPEQTVGPAGFLGETGCSLNSSQNVKNARPLFLYGAGLLSLFILFMIRRVKKTSWIPVQHRVTSCRSVPGMTKKSVFFILLVCISLLLTTQALAQERTPQNWTVELKGNLWVPSSSNIKTFFGPCCNFGGEVEAGYLFTKQINLTFSTGMGYKTGDAIGLSSGTTSNDKFSLTMIPLRLDLVYRADFKPEQFILPYARAGGDAVLFRESSGGNSINGIKYGFHGGIGVGFLLDRLESLSGTMENEMGINDVYLIVEGRYSIINNFQSTGLDLSGFYPYLGVLFEF